MPSGSIVIAISRSCAENDDGETNLDAVVVVVVSDDDDDDSSSINSGIRTLSVSTRYGASPALSRQPWS